MACVVESGADVSGKRPVAQSSRRPHIVDNLLRLLDLAECQKVVLRVFRQYPFGNSAEIKHAARSCSPGIVCQVPIGTLAIDMKALSQGRQKILDGSQSLTDKRDHERGHEVECARSSNVNQHFLRGSVRK